jgi:hypothetical protein
MKKTFPCLPGLVVFLIVFTTACASRQPAQSGTDTASPAPVNSTQTLPAPTQKDTLPPSSTPTRTPTLQPTKTPSPSLTPTITNTPSPINSPTITATSTRTPVAVSVKMQANCRYGPGTAYLYRWGLYPGDTAQIDGKNGNGTWFWIKPFNLDSHCWASEIVFNETVDKTYIHVVQVPLPKTTFAGPPGNVTAVRSGDQVTVSWDVVPLSDDKRRGYLLEVTSCQDSVAVYLPVQTDDTAYTFTDTGDCSVEAGGLLYTAEKHGYSDPVTIPWPE